MKRKVVLFLYVILIITILSALASCELLACRTLISRFFIAAPNQNTTIPIELSINGNKMTKTSEVLLASDKYYQIVKEAFPYSEIWNNKSDSIYEYYFNTNITNIKSKNVINICAEHEGELYKGSFILEKLEYSDIDEFTHGKEFILKAQNGKVLHGLYIYHYWESL